MKKITLFLFLLPITALAKFREGTVIYNDGTSKAGFLEIPAATEPVKFKTEMDGKAEKIAINDLKEFNITEGKETIHFYAIYTAQFAAFNAEKINIAKDKCWARLEKEGKISLYSVYEGTTTYRAPGFVQSSSVENIRYYIKRPENNYAVMYFMLLGGGGGTIAMNNYKSLKKMTKAHFEKDCPNLVDLVDPEDFKKNGITRIVDLYDANCGAK